MEFLCKKMTLLYCRKNKKGRNVIKDGKEVGRTVGVQPKEEIISMLK